MRYLIRKSDYLTWVSGTQQRWMERANSSKHKAVPRDSCFHSNSLKRHPTALILGNSKTGQSFYKAKQKYQDTQFSI